VTCLTPLRLVQPLRRASSRGRFILSQGLRRSASLSDSLVSESDKLDRLGTHVTMKCRPRKPCLKTARSILNRFSSGSLVVNMLLTAPMLSVTSLTCSVCPVNSYQMVLTTCLCRIPPLRIGFRLLRLTGKRASPSLIPNTPTQPRDGCFCK
jgi:hypothetical protein